MAYIYQITNDINHKIYVGKTEFNINKRFKEHCNDAFKRDKEKRPLYSAMRKYGIEHFHVSLLEETQEPEIREQYWIERLGSFKYGYNATLGGDGSKYLDYDLILKTYNQLHNIQATANICQVHRDSVTAILLQHNIPIKNTADINKDQFGKCIGMYKDNQLLNTFTSLHDAGRYIIQIGKTTQTNPKRVAANITRAAHGKVTQAFGYTWKFL